MNTLREARPDQAATVERSETRGRSAEVILIPKQLRMEWTDAMAVDSTLPALAFRVGCVIGVYFNRHRGDTYVRQDTIAGMLGITVRAVRGAVGELEARGWLVVERRDLGQRGDGRRVCGGRGVANTYAPALDGERVAATAGAKRLAERVERAFEEVASAAAVRAASVSPATGLAGGSGRADPAAGDRKEEPRFLHSAEKGGTTVPVKTPERRNHGSGKEEPRFLPTLTDPSDQNPSRARGGAATAAPLGALGPALQRRLGATIFRSWFSEIAFEAVLPGKVPELVLAAPSRFIADRILSHHAADVLACFNALQPAKGRCGRLAMVVKAGVVR